MTEGSVAGLEQVAAGRAASSVPLPLLERARVASPCPMKWADLTPTGREVVRHCGACGLHVYNFAGLTSDEAESLLREKLATGERLCGALWRRADGTILTKDCPIGWRAARQRALRTASRIAAAIGLLLTGGLVVGGQRADRLARIRGVEPFRTISEWISPSPPPRIMGAMVMGEFCVTPTPAPTPAPTPPPTPAVPEESGEPGQEAP